MKWHSQAMSNQAPINHRTNIPRSESLRLLTGRGQFIHSVALPRMLHLAFVRSPVAHANIGLIDSVAAAGLPGVAAIYTASDFGPIIAEIPQTKLDTMPSHISPPQLPLAGKVVRFQGEPVAVIAADTLLQAEDAAAAIHVEYDHLPVVSGISAECGAGENIASVVEIGSGVEDTDDMVRLKAEFSFGRQSGVSLEPRGIVADYDPHEDRLTVAITHQSPHLVQVILARLLGMPEHRVLVRTGDVGGGFGVKLHIYPDEIAAVACARLLAQPVKFIATRSEAFQSDAQAREFEVSGSIYLSASGEITGMTAEFDNAIGAYSIFPRSSIGDSIQAATLLGAPYSIAGLKTKSRTHWQNKTPSGAIRGVGQPIPCVVTEQLMDVAARHLGEDPVEFRRRHYLEAEMFPLTTIGGVYLERLSLGECLDDLVEVMSYDALRQEQAMLRDKGIWRGIGIASFVEQTAVGPALYGAAGVPVTSIEECRIRLEADGMVRVETGATDQGQGTLTGIRQIVAGILRLDLKSVEVASSDSSGARGGGAWASRGLSLAGEAAALSAETLKDNILGLAASQLQARPEDLSLSDGIVLGDKGVSLSLADLAQLVWFKPLDMPEGSYDLLSVNRSFTLQDRPHFVANGVMGSLVEIDPETGAVQVLRLWVVEDCGTIVNHDLVDGQIIGGSAQGIGQTLGEQCYYDESGQLLSGTFMDYAVPRANLVPPMEVCHVTTPQEGTMLGVKGVGEAGTVGAPAAIWCAINDALAPIGARAMSQPFTSERVYRAITKALQSAQ
ncbi:MAG: xanthine dehydrogenase family protein molybdopterin-binding subunit [Pseudomonadota bacterium]|nr:xanthine dehydrogenase family protein molybdopterin-binding subunit [Pseudomonadota bacterium]